jgi:ectoine hydroxylase-related dioxygenase (phytanoyl-CoA dioxygenase family)
MTLHGTFDAASCDIDAFRALIDQTLDPVQVPLADRIARNIPVYDMDRHRTAVARRGTRLPLMAEWAWVLAEGPGVLVLERAFADPGVMDAVTEVYRTIIAREAGGSGSDHFAAGGANARVWNSLQKLCLDAPDLFALYFGNQGLDTVAEAWLGQGYQMTAQVNLVHPGGKPQEPHRDYHLGFQSQTRVAQYPTHVHRLSPYLTLQGAVAHCDMPVESGPTQLLPYSQQFAAGYLAAHLPAFRALFQERQVQLALSKGDAVFFNPALFHAAGENRSSDIARMANLLQISSPFGRAMEAIDRDAMCRALYPVLREMLLGKPQRISLPEAHVALAAAAEGYAFPTNLDTDPPLHGNAPTTQASAFRYTLDMDLPVEDFYRSLDEYAARRRP